MKPGPITKLDKKNKATFKKIDLYILPRNCDIIVFFSNLWPISSNPEAGYRMHSL